MIIVKTSAALIEDYRVGVRDFTGIEVPKGSYLGGEDFSKAIFREANLKGLSAQGIKFTESGMEGANLRGSFLLGACFYGANLRQANLNGSRLSGAMFMKADLRNADFKNTKMATVITPTAKGNIKEIASFEGADLRGADFRGADFGESSMDKNTRLEGMIIDGPEGIEYSLK